MTFPLIICWDEQMIKTDDALPERLFILPEGAPGEGISKGNIVPLGPPVGVRDPLRRGPGFLLLFSIKSKEERPCFAERVPNGRILMLPKKNHSATALNQCEALLIMAQLRPIGACAVAFSCPHLCRQFCRVPSALTPLIMARLRPIKKEPKGSFFVNPLKTVSPHLPLSPQYNPPHAPQTPPCPHSRIPQQCRESRWHVRPRCQISCPQS